MLIKCLLHVDYIFVILCSFVVKYIFSWGGGWCVCRAAVPASHAAAYAAIIYYNAIHNFEFPEENIGTSIVILLYIQFKFILLYCYFSY
jgi:hypothetical protein